MIVKVRTVPIADALIAGRRPRAMLPRPAAGEGTDRGESSSVFQGAAPKVGQYLIADGPLTDDPIEWSLCRQGDYVPIALYAYVSGPNKDSPGLNVAMLEAGFKAGLSVGLRNHKPLELILVRGDQVTPVDGGLRWYLGVAVRIE